MSSFGETLRKYRQNSKDINSSRHLSQERLGELLGEELGLQGGYSGAAVSDWERGKSQISASDRRMLLSILKVLYRQGGLKNVRDADNLLDAGNYKGLRPDEKIQVFPKEVIDDEEQDDPPLFKNRRKWILFWSGNLFYDNENLTEQLANAEDGPPPSWPRKVVVLINGGMAGWNVFRTLRLFLWFLLLLFSTWLIAPSMRWPFSDSSEAFSAIIMYSVGSFAIPALVGLFTNTQNNQYWQKISLVSTRNLRLYTHQGAAVGFHVGYFGIFTLNLVFYYFGSETSQWLELMGVVFLLVVSYWSAHLIPHNLWQAYQRLNLADGAVFFVFMFLGPVWGVFFYYSYLLILDPVFGPWMVLSACGLLILGMAWQYRRTGTTIIPVHWWVFLGGFVLVSYQMTVAQNIFSVVALANVLVTLGVLLALERIRYTLHGILGFLLAIFALQFVLSFDLWVGRALTGVALFLWWRWRKEYLSFPPVFWGVLATMIVCLLVWKEQWLSDFWASIAFSMITIALLLWDYREHRPAA
jgi:transcriptional regulator with XRE-family HTH domain